MLCAVRSYTPGSITVNGVAANARDGVAIDGEDTIEVRLIGPRRERIYHEAGAHTPEGMTFAEIVRLVLINWVPVTGGYAGISNIPKPTVFGYSLGSELSGLAATLVRRGVAQRFHVHGDDRQRNRRVRQGDVDECQTGSVLVQPPQRVVGSRR